MPPKKCIIVIEITALLKTYDSNLLQRLSYLIHEGIGATRPLL